MISTKLKLDENLGTRGADVFSSAGHDVTTVAQQNMTSASDADLIAVCRTEERCLVSLDLDFGNPFLFKPSEYAGIAVLRLPPKAAETDLWEACATLAKAMSQSEIRGKLWVVQRNRIREYQPDDDD